MINPEATVFLVDDDDGVRDALTRLIELHGFRVDGFSSYDQLLKTLHVSSKGCLLLDLKTPDTDAVAVLEQLRQQGYRQPAIVISAWGNASDVTGAMRRGAIDFLQKPVDASILLERVEEALQIDQKYRSSVEEFAIIEERYNRLSPRELQVAELVVQGLAGKQIAKRLGINARTVEVHRSRVVRKMEADSVVSVVRMLTTREYILLSRAIPESIKN